MGEVRGRWPEEGALAHAEAVLGEVHVGPLDARVRGVGAHGEGDDDVRHLRAVLRLREVVFRRERRAVRVLDRERLAARGVRRRHHGDVPRLREAFEPPHDVLPGLVVAVALPHEGAGRGEVVDAVHNQARDLAARRAFVVLDPRLKVRDGHFAVGELPDAVVANAPAEAPQVAGRDHAGLGRLKVREGHPGEVRHEPELRVALLHLAGRVEARLLRPVEHRRGKHPDERHRLRAARAARDHREGAAPCTPAEVVVHLRQPQGDAVPRVRRVETRDLRVRRRVILVGALAPRGCRPDQRVEACANVRARHAEALDGEDALRVPREAVARRRVPRELHRRLASVLREQERLRLRDHLRGGEPRRARVLCVHRGAEHRRARGELGGALLPGVHPPLDALQHQHGRRRAVATLPRDGGARLDDQRCAGVGEGVCADPLPEGRPRVVVGSEPVREGLREGLRERVVEPRQGRGRAGRAEGRAALYDAEHGVALRWRGERRCGRGCVGRHPGDAAHRGA